MEILAINIGEYWSEYIWPIFLFIAGLGLMVFVHELGHFLVAKRVGIKVQRFALGMGPRLFGIKRGGTDYCVNALPLGGYVKMLGQDDFKPLKEGDRFAPGSFESKSVGARFAVISAGVIMNLILAAVLFIIIGLVGKNFVAPVVGGTSPGDPASQARIVWQDDQKSDDSLGLKSGDKILKIEGDSIVLWACGEKIEHFQDLMMTAALADPADKYTVTIEREVEGKKRIGKTEIGLKSSGGVLRFGIALPLDTVFTKLEDVVIASPFRENDRIVAIDGEKIERLWQIDKIEEKLTGKCVTVTVLRKNETVDIPVQPGLFVSEKVFHLKDGAIVRGEIIDRNEIKVKRPQPDGKTKDVRLNEFTVRLADGSTRKILQDDLKVGLLGILGMTPRVCVLFVSKGSPAEKEGVKPGDVIAAYGDQRTPTIEQIKEISKQVKDNGVTITVLRDGQEKKITLAPKKRNGQFRIGIQMVADPTTPVAASVRPGSPAAEVGIPEESLITAINDTKVGSWIDVYNALKGLTGKKVIITYRLGEQEQKAEIAELDESLFRPEDYSFRIFAGDVAFKPLMVKIKQDGVIDSLVWGGRVTIKLVLSSYLSIRSLIRGWVPLDQTAGPIGIGTIAVAVGRRSFIDFLYFLGFISAAIAVFNFLPIPVVDGGFAVLLIIEKIRGKPLSARVMNIVQVVGWALLLSVIVLVTWNDIMRLVRNMW